VPFALVLTARAAGAADLLAAPTPTGTLDPVVVPTTDPPPGAMKRLLDEEVLLLLPAAADPRLLAAAALRDMSPFEDAEWSFWRV